MRDSDRILGLLASKTKRAEEGKEPVAEHLLVTRYSPKRVAKGEMLSLADVNDILAIPLLAVIPESQAVLMSSNAGVPVILDANSDAGLAYADAVARFLGDELPSYRFIEEKTSWLKRVFNLKSRKMA